MSKTCDQKFQMDEADDIHRVEAGWIASSKRLQG